MNSSKRAPSSSNSEKFHHDARWLAWTSEKSPEILRRAGNSHLRGMGNACTRLQGPVLAGLAGKLRRNADRRLLR